MRALVFPGQGSQYVGMGQQLVKNFQSAKYIVQEVDDALSFKLSSLMANGPQDELQSTVNTQPALFTVSAAILKVLNNDFNLNINQCCHFIAGHSLGEYSAYYAGHSLSLTNTAQIVRERGRAMQLAVPAGVGGMVALIGGTLEQAELLVKQSSTAECYCEIANDNAPGQIIISGHLQALENLKVHAAAINLKRIIALPVSAPFHCSLMQGAADHMRDFLSGYNFTPPQIPLISNTTAAVIEPPYTIVDSLIDQITDRVRWRETIEIMRDAGVTEIVEVGAGKVLAGLIKRITPDINVISIEGPESIEDWVKSL